MFGFLFSSWRQKHWRRGKLPNHTASHTCFWRLDEEAFCSNQVLECRWNATVVGSMDQPITIISVLANITCRCNARATIEARLHLRMYMYRYGRNPSRQFHKPQPPWEAL